MSTDNELLRSIVKDALREALGGLGDGRDLAKKLSMDLQPTQVVEVVSLATNAEVNSFVNRVLDMAAESQTLSALRDGRIVFQLSQQSTDRRSESMNNRIDKGALTESSIMKAAEVGSTVIVAWRVVVTSLAREKARDLGVTIIRESKQENQRGSVIR